MKHLDVTKWWKGTEEDIWKALRYLSFLTKEKHNKVLSILGKNFIVELVCGAIFWSCFDWAFFHLIGGNLASSVALISYKWWNTRCLGKWKFSTINFFFMLPMNFSSKICRRLAPSPETLTRLTLTTTSSSAAFPKCSFEPLDPSDRVSVIGPLVSVGIRSISLPSCLLIVNTPSHKQLTLLLKRNLFSNPQEIRLYLTKKSSDLYGSEVAARWY